MNIHWNGTSIGMLSPEDLDMIDDYYVIDDTESSSNSDGEAFRETNGDGSKRHHKASLYKTELCRSYEEVGYCRYGDKCQFAHGEKELRIINRHPRYKTEICKTYHTIGTCPYGKRCKFIHMDGLSRSLWSPTSPFNYIILHHERLGMEAKFDINDYFRELQDGNDLPSSSILLSQRILHKDSDWEYIQPETGPGPHRLRIFKTIETGSNPPPSTLSLSRSNGNFSPSTNGYTFPAYYPFEEKPIW